MSIHISSDYVLLCYIGRIQYIDCCIYHIARYIVEFYFYVKIDHSQAWHFWVSLSSSWSFATPGWWQLGETKYREDFFHHSNIEISSTELYKWTKDYATSTTHCMHSKCMMPRYATYHLQRNHWESAISFENHWSCHAFRYEVPDFLHQFPTPRLHPLGTSLARSHKRLSLLTWPPRTPVTLGMPGCP